MPPVEVTVKKMANKPRKSRKTKRAVIIMLTAVLIAAAVFVIARAVDSYLSDSGENIVQVNAKYKAGTYVNGVDISNMDYSGALDAVTRSVAQDVDNFNCRLHTGEKEFSLSGRELGITSDIRQVLETALYKNGEYDVAYSIDEAKLAQKLESLAEEIDVAPVPPQIVVCSDYTASLESGRFSYSEPQNGSQMDVKATAELILDWQTDIEIPVEEVHYSASEHGSVPTPVMRGAFSTSFSSRKLSRPSRVHNIIKAAGLINGVKLAPGEVFSCNDCLGPRTEGRGWQPAPAIIDGGAGTEDQPGGGVCQVSTTLYNAVLRSDLEIVYRQGHSKKSQYADGGADATIDTYGIDFTWKNNTDSDLYVFMWVDEKKKECYCEIYGAAFPEEFDTIDVESEFIEDIPPSKTEYKVDKSLSPNGCILVNEAITGSIYKTYKVYYLNGVEVNREYVTKTTYRMHPKRYRVGVDYPLTADGEPIPVTPSPSPSPTEQPTAMPTATPAQPTPTLAPPSPTPYVPTPEPPSEPPQTPEP